MRNEFSISAFSSSEGVSRVRNDAGPAVHIAPEGWNQKAWFVFNRRGGNVAVATMKLKLMTRPQFEDVSDLEWLEPARNGSRPFDLSELDKLPQPTDDDPPYHSWWVVDKL